MQPVDMPSYADAFSKFNKPPQKHTMKNTTQQIKARACQIMNIANPDWGTFGVMEDNGSYYEISGDSGTRVLSKSEADRFWKLV